MPEGIVPYPRWQGTLSDRSRVPVIIMNEVRRALQERWSLVALLLGLAWGFASIIEFYNLREAGAGVHDYEGMVAMLRQLLWFSLGVGAAVGGPMLLDDQRVSALELYLSRAVTPIGYLTGKVAALTALTTLVVFLPAMALWGASFVFYDSRPDNWGWAIFPLLGFSLMWGLMVTGLALGFSSVGRSSAGAALVLFGGFATLEYLVDPPGILQRVATITSLTEDARWAILSPFSAVEGQLGWLLSIESPHIFPYWWGLLVWGALTGLGWAMVAWKHPRARGDERA